ncbi:hypothetical protein EJB05_28639, partial [Eragrostis curvula]
MKGTIECIACQTSFTLATQRNVRTASCDAAAVISARASGFEPSVWGDFFIRHEPQLQRLGVDHLFEEVDTALHDIYGSDYTGSNLHEVALRFRLLREHGFWVSPGQGEINVKLCMHCSVAFASQLCTSGLEEILRLTSTRRKAKYASEMVLYYASPNLVPTEDAIGRESGSTRTTSGSGAAAGGGEERHGGPDLVDVQRLTRRAGVGRPRVAMDAAASSAPRECTASVTQRSVSASMARLPRPRERNQGELPGAARRESNASWAAGQARGCGRARRAAAEQGTGALPRACASRGGGAGDAGPQASMMRGGACAHGGRRRSRGRGAAGEHDARRRVRARREAAEQGTPFSPRPAHSVGRRRKKEDGEIRVAAPRDRAPVPAASQLADASSAEAATFGLDALQPIELAPPPSAPMRAGSFDWRNFGNQIDPMRAVVENFPLLLWWN